MRFPWTIWRYAITEVGRLVLLTTAVCVLVVAFAATVKPMAEGKLGAADAFRYMFLAIPPMLQYVLPFAAGFGTTLAFHRMASENELDAARLGGVSFRALLAPAWGTGLVLAGVLGLLSGEIVPRYWRAMEAIVSQDVTGMITHSINRGESLTIGNVVIYADRVDRLDPEPGREGDAYDRMVLTRVAVLVLDKQGRVDAESTASRAWVWFKRDESGNTTATVQLENSSFGGASGDRAGAEGATRTFTIPSTFRDDVKFLTLGELRALPADPDRLNVVDVRRRDLAFHIAREEVMRSLHAELQAQRRARLQDASGRTITVEGAGLVRREEADRDLKWVVLPAATGADVEIEMIDPSSLTETHRRYAAESAFFTSSIGTDPHLRFLTLTLHLEQGGQWVPEVSAPAKTRKSLDFTELLPRVNPLDDLLAMKSRALVVEARRRQARAPDENIARPLRELTRRLLYVERDVTSRQHEIAAIAASCLVMVLTGSVTAIRLRNRLPVPVYLWSFFPGIGSVLVVNAGKEMARSAGTPGLIVIWAGLAALALYAAIVYAAIRRH